MEFSISAINLCKDIILTAYDFTEKCVLLKEELVFCNVLNETDDFDSVMSNKDFKKALKNHLATGLNEDPKTSKWGKLTDKILISDFDLYFKCRVEKDARFYLDEKFKDITIDEYNEAITLIKRKGKNLNTWLVRQREIVIYSMDFLNTPDIQYLKKELSEKKKKKMEEKLNKSSDDIKEEVNKKLFKSPKSVPFTYVVDDILEDDILDKEDLDETMKEDENEPDELDNVPEEYKTAEGYLKDDFVEEQEENSEQEIKGLAKMFKKRHENIANGNIQDLYETDPEQLEEFLEFHPIDKDTIIFEPCKGNGAISNVFKKNGYTVIERDKYIPNEDGELHDFLEAEMPTHFDLIFTNPPFNGKGKFIERCIDANKPFVLLLPLKTLTQRKVLKNALDKVGLKIVFPKRDMKFLHKGKWVQPEDCAWFISTESIGLIEMIYM
jgi:hypothetical protein